MSQPLKNIQNTPIITFVMAYRVREATNISAMNTFLNSIQDILPIDKIELLVKLDLDDSVAQKMFFCPETGFLAYNSKYTFPIRPFSFRRWEGRWTLHHFYHYLFTQRNEASKFTAFINDDVTIIRNPIEDVEKESRNNYVILGNYQTKMNKEKLDRVGLKNNWLTSEYICSYPFISNKIIEICGNTSYESYPDNWLTLLYLTLHKKYGVLLPKHIDEYVFRKNIGRTDSFGVEFDYDNRFLMENFNKKSYYFKLVGQQAKNIYLNMKEDGVI